MKRENEDKEINVHEARFKKKEMLLLMQNLLFASNTLKENIEWNNLLGKIFALNYGDSSKKKINKNYVKWNLKIYFIKTFWTTIIY